MQLLWSPNFVVFLPPREVNMTPDNWVNLGYYLCGAAFVIGLLTYIIIVVKTKAAAKIANAPLPKMDMNGLPSFLKRNHNFTIFTEAKQRAEQHGKAIKSLAPTIWLGNLSLTLSGIVFIVGLIMIVVGFLQKYPPSWW